MNVLVFDVGTSGMRGILFTHEGRELTMSQYRYHAMYLPDSWVEQDPSDWETALYNITKDVVAAAKENHWGIDAITITSQRSSVIPVDAAIYPLRNAIMWQDKRTSEICKELEPQNERIFRLSGSRVNPVFAAGKMTWIREQAPEIYRKTEKFLVIPDYLNYLITGELVTDHTYGSRSHLMNLHTQEWDDELLDLFRVERNKLCELVEPGTIFGKTTAGFAQITGCPEGIPVLSSGGDQQCGAIGQGVVKPGVLSVTAGSGGYLIAATDEIPCDLAQDVICNCSSVEGQYILESSVLTCCSAFDWFRKEFYPGTDFDEINRLIAEEPIGSNGCLCIPYFQGRSTPDWNNEAKGTFANVTLATTRQDMMRALLEGICYEIGNGIDTMEKYVKIQKIYVNGGLTNSKPFNEMQSNVYGFPVTRLGKADATARGALIIATTGLGLYDSAADAFAVIGKSDDVQKYDIDPEAVEQYQQYKMQMNDLYRKIK